MVRFEVILVVLVTTRTPIGGGDNGIAEAGKMPVVSMTRRPIVCSVVFAVATAGSVSAQTSEPSESHEWALAASPLEMVSLADGDPPSFPEPYHGYRRDGDVAEDQMRVFGTVEVSPVDQDGSMNNCGDRYWAIRWRSLNADIAVIATAFVDVHPYDYVSSDLQLLPAGHAGLVVGHWCTTPAFYRVGGPANQLVDVIFETQWYTVSVDQGNGAPMPIEWIPEAEASLPAWVPGDVDCSFGYEIAYDPPYGPCVQSFRIVVIQDRLTTLGFPIDTDGYYGTDTYNAECTFQQSVGLVPDGRVGMQTWAALLDGAANLMVFDIDANGIITPDEIPLGE